MGLGGRRAEGSIVCSPASPRDSNVPIAMLSRVLSTRYHRHQATAVISSYRDVQYHGRATGSWSVTGLFRWTASILGLLIVMLQ